MAGASIKHDQRGCGPFGWLHARIRALWSPDKADRRARGDVLPSKKQVAPLTRDNVVAALKQSAETRKPADFSNRDLSICDLSDLDLSGCNFGHAILRRADFSGANLTGANLEDAELEFASLHDAILTNARLSRANLTEATVTDANLEGADLEKAVLLRADLRGVEAKKAKFVDADLSKAKLQGAGFDGANFRGATLAQVDIGIAAPGAPTWDFSHAKHVDILLPAEATGGEPDETVSDWIEAYVICADASIQQRIHAIEPKELRERLIVEFVQCVATEKRVEQNLYTGIHTRAAAALLPVLCTPSYENMGDYTADVRQWCMQNGLLALSGTLSVGNLSDARLLESIASTQYALSILEYPATVVCELGHMIASLLFSAQVAESPNIAAQGAVLRDTYLQLIDTILPSAMGARVKQLLDADQVPLIYKNGAGAVEAIVISEAGWQQARSLTPINPHADGTIRVVSAHAAEDRAISAVDLPAYDRRFTHSRVMATFAKPVAQGDGFSFTHLSQTVNHLTEVLGLPDGAGLVRLYSAAIAQLLLHCELNLESANAIAGLKNAYWNQIPADVLDALLYEGIPSETNHLIPILSPDGTHVVVMSPAEFRGETLSDSMLLSRTEDGMWYRDRLEYFRPFMWVTHSCERMLAIHASTGFLSMDQHTQRALLEHIGQAWDSRRADAERFLCANSLPIARLLMDTAKDTGLYAYHALARYAYARHPCIAKLIESKLMMQLVKFRGEQDSDGWPILSSDGTQAIFLNRSTLERMNHDTLIRYAASMDIFAFAAETASVEDAEVPDR